MPQRFFVRNEIRQNSGITLIKNMFMFLFGNTSTNLSVGGSIVDIAPVSLDHSLCKYSLSMLAM